MTSKSKFIPPPFSSHVFPEMLKFRVRFILFPVYATARLGANPATAVLPTAILTVPYLILKWGNL